MIDHLTSPQQPHTPHSGILSWIASFSVALNQAYSPRSPLTPNMLATSNFVKQVHNGTVNNNPISDDITSETTPQMTSNKQVSFSSTNVNNSLDGSKIMPVNNSEMNQITTDFNGDSTTQHQGPDESSENKDEDSVDITISNVVSNFSVRCHLNLRQIATIGSNVVYRRDQSVSVLY